MLVLTLVAAMAVTPTVKLYLRSLQADQAMSGLLKKAAPVLQQREALTRTELTLALTESLAARAHLVQWAARMALANGITHFVDDDRKVLALFARFAPSVAAIDFEDRERLLRRPITSAEP